MSMARFEYDRMEGKTEYYEALQQLMDRWEYETVEFKEAKGQYSEDKIGQYFSAISNEANISGLQFGWLILGVSEQKDKYPVGTSFKEGDPSLLEKFKYIISRETTDGMTFLEIVELFPIYEGKRRRVLMFKIPAAAAGMPTEWKTRYYGRDGDSLVPLQQYKIDLIRDQERKDWSKRLIARSCIDDLDPAAIAIAREKYKEKMNRPHISEEIDRLSDEEFLTKQKLMRDGKLTNAAMVLLGKPEHSDVFESPPLIMWRLYHQDGTVQDYEIFEIPFISVSDRILEKIRFLTYRYLPNPRSLFTHEVTQYDRWSLRELISNCIAHSNYQSGGRIYVNELNDYLTITNPGRFIPRDVREVLKPEYNPPYYKNALLASAMTNFRMIDTATSGIKKIFRIQKERFFPLPDYGMPQSYQVTVTVYGKILNDQYTYILHDHPELDLETVYLLDQIQKGKIISDQDQKYLLEQHLIRIEDDRICISNQVSETDRKTGTETDTKRGLETEKHTETTNKTGTETENHTETTNKTNIETDRKTETGTETDRKTETGTENKTGTKTGTKTTNKISTSKSAQEVTQESAQEITQEGVQEVAQEITREITQENAQESAQENANDIPIENSIIRLIIEKPEITRYELAQRLHISPDNVKYRLGKLKKLGMIEHQGSTKAGKWAVIAQNAESKMR